MKKSLAAFALSVLLTFGVSAVFENVNNYENSFFDVKETAWYANDVKTAYELGLMNGKGENTFDPDGNVTVAESVAVASRFHAIYNGNDIDSYTKQYEDICFDFDNTDNLEFNHCDGEIKDGVLILSAKPRPNNGRYDPGVYLKNLSIDARVYNKLVVRMKRDRLENPYEESHRSELLEVFFVNDDDVLMRQERCVTKRLVSDEMSEWFEVEIDMSQNELWRDNIKQIRFDPTNNNGIYYIDYMFFAEGKVKNNKWYNKYIDYAVENGIIKQGEFKEADFARNITRVELCRMFATALPEKYFTAINAISSIPDVDKNDKNADVLIMLYRAGIVLGNENGYFNPDSDIKRSETAAIINRVAIPENRLKGSVTTEERNENSIDYEFNSESDIENLKFEAESVFIKDGALVLKAKERSGNALKYDPKIIDMNTEIDADMYPVMRIRMKVEIPEILTNTRCDIFFMHEDDETFTEADSYHPDLFEDSYVDEAGWYVIELNMFKAKNWKGKIKAFRFDPSNNGGTYTVDYIRFVRNDAKEIISDEDLERYYTSRRVFPDETFENGFVVNYAGVRLTGERQAGAEGVWNYNDSENEPLWEIGPWWTDYDFLANRDTSTDKYTLADKQGIKSLKYDPKEKSLTFTLNADKVYNGQPHNSGELWPHLIIIHDPYKDDYSLVPEERKPDLELKADKVYAELDIKLNSFMDSENREGELLSNFLIFFYFAHKDIPDIHTYFGLRPVGFNNDAGRQYGWHNDSHSTMKIYSVPMMDLYENEEVSPWREDGNLVSAEWKHIRVDITAHIENMIRLCNDENVYGRQVSVEDFWISGVNAGYEIRGNFRMEVEMKNLNLVCCNKNED